MNPLKKVKIKWSPGFAYIIGLIASDGNLVKDGRHINFTSKDLDLVILFKHHLKIKNKIGKKGRNKYSEKKYYFIQFGDVNFYKLLLKIGLKPRKSKTLTNLIVPKKYFFDFLRGYFDGDGNTISYFDKRWKNSYMFYLNFSSASPYFIEWLRKTINISLGIKGHIIRQKKKSTIQLRFGKREVLILIRRMYCKRRLPSLKRKYLKIKTCLNIIYKTLRASAGTGRQLRLRGAGHLLA